MLFGKRDFLPKVPVGPGGFFICLRLLYIFIAQWYIPVADDVSDCRAIDCNLPTSFLVGAPPDSLDYSIPEKSAAMIHDNSVPRSFYAPYVFRYRHFVFSCTLMV